VSLAVADLCVSLVVMPFCIVHEFIGQYSLIIIIIIIIIVIIIIII